MTSHSPSLYCVWQLWTISFLSIAEKPITDVICPLFYRENLSNLGSYAPDSVGEALFFMRVMSINVQLPWNTRYLNKITFSKNYYKLNSMVHVICFSGFFSYHPSSSNITRRQVPSRVRAWFYDSAGDIDFYQMSLSQLFYMHDSII